MRITFILPGFISIPMGGVKVVQEYANRLSEKGHKVTLVYPIQIQTNLRYYLKKFLVQQYDTFTGNDRELYYTPDPKEAVLIVKNISEKYIPNSDAIIAVGWQTANSVANLSTDCGKKYYLLQSFETYFGNVKAVLQTYHLPLKKIAVSSWIIDEIKALGESAAGPLCNAINTDEFYIEPNSVERHYDVMVLYHPSKIKCVKDALNVLKNLRFKNPKLSVIIVAPRKPVHHIPKWISVHIKPDIDLLRKLYNSSKVFLHTSHWEGWGLPVMEAMACGCAVVAYQNRGVKEYLIHEYNALMSPIGNTEALTTQVNHLLINDKQRKLLVENGLKTVNQFSWESSVTIFENILIQNM